MCEVGWDGFEGRRRRSMSLDLDLERTRRVVVDEDQRMVRSVIGDPWHYTKHGKRQGRGREEIRVMLLLNSLHDRLE